MAKARAFIWSTTQSPDSLFFSDFQTLTVSLSQLVSVFAWGACVPQILVFKQLSLARQDRSPQPRPWLQSFSLLLFHLCWCRSTQPAERVTGGKEVRGFQLFFFFFLQGLTIADHSGCAQAAFWLSQNSVWRKMFQL